MVVVSAEKMPQLLRDFPDLRLHIVGDLECHQKRSLARAESVAKEFVDRYAIASDRLLATGVGPLSPVASNRTGEGRAQNRRVELVEC